MRNPFQHSAAGSGSFLPHDYVKGKNDFRANLLCLGLFSIVMAGVIGAFFVTSRSRIQIKREQDLITAEYVKEKTRIEQLEQLDAQNEELLGKADVTTALLEPIPRSVLLSELVQRRPEKIALLEIRLEGKRQKQPQVAGGSNASAGGVNSLSGRPPAQVASKTPPAKAKAPAKGGKTGEKARARVAAAPKVEAPRFEYSLKIVGVAEVNTEITDYLKALQESPILDGVDLKYIEGTSIDKDDFRKFEIQAVFRKGADGRSLLAKAEEASSEKSQPAGQPASNPAPVTSDATSGKGD